MKNSLISVIVPAYNREKFIYDCLNSVYKQTYRPIELIIIDDGSSDNTPEIIKGFQKEKHTEDFKIEYITQENSGAQVARNKGIKHSHGDFIQFFDSDDVLNKNKLEVQFNFFMKNPSCDICYTNGDFIDENNTITDFELTKPLTNTEYDYFYGMWQCMTALYKRDAVMANGYWNESLSINQDWEYALRAIINNFNIAFIDKKLCYYRQHSGESIGSNLTVKKIKGKELSTDSIYNLVKNKNKMSVNLENIFFKRYLYCTIQYGLLKAYDEKNKLIEKINKKKNSRLLSLLKYNNYSIIYQLIMYLYTFKNRNNNV